MGKKLLTQITKCSLSIPSIVFFTLVFGVGISDCTISSNHHHCILVFLFGATSGRQTGIQEIQIFKATNEY